jgi:aryl-phospho-beta-D-glucosidase BglC (GH1 family)
MEFLKAAGDKIVSASGQEVRLRGVCVGGYLHLENYMHGFPGAETSMRTALLETLGRDKSQFFWDRWMDYFFTENDVIHIRSLGANVIRMALNYRQFEDDGKPFEYLETGFQRLDRVLEWCEEHELYVILDMHAAQGWQNTDWHSDNSHRHTFLWQDKLYQDRFISLWEEFARWYKDKAVIAGYDLMNEPVSHAPYGRFGYAYQPDWPRFNSLIHRTVDSIRAQGDTHIIFIEGDLYGTRFYGLEEPFAYNLAYSAHHYHPMTRGGGAYPGKQPNGETWNVEFQRQLLNQHEGVRWARDHSVPLWMGEFGAQYLEEKSSVAGQMQALDEQIGIFEELGLHWTYWNYKDIGVAGWIHIPPDSPYARLIEPVTQVKRALTMDPSTSYLIDPAVAGEFMGLANHLVNRLNDPSIDRAANITFMGQITLTLYLATLYQSTFARLFASKTEKELDELARSFLFQNCMPSRQLMTVIQNCLKPSKKGN